MSDSNQPPNTFDNQKNKFKNWASSSVSLKFVVIGVLILILLIPSSMVQNIIRERQYRMEEVIGEVSSKWGNSQTITGPVISVPYLDSYNRRKNLHLLPEKLDINGVVNPTAKHRNIYDVVVYNTDLKVNGNFKLPGIHDLDQKCDSIIWDEAEIYLGITDMAGIQKQIQMKLNDKSYEFEPGVPTADIISSGVSSPIRGFDSIKTSNINFNFDLNVNGSENLYFVPVGKTTNVNLTSEWTDPSFQGKFLPENPDNVSDDGFKANWSVLHLNRNYPQFWTGDKYSVYDSSFGVELLLPVDQYRKTYRSAKYAVLVMTLTFLALLFIELLSGIKIHPVQYLLIGLGLTLFYSLLLSLAEHLGFQVAYAISSAMIIGLVVAYSKAVFKKARLVAITGGILVIIYGFIYTLLQMQDYSLLVGSLGLFFALAVIMKVSSNIKWFSVSE